MRADPVRSRNAHQKTQTDGRNAQRAVRSHSHIELSEPKRELLAFIRREGGRTSTRHTKTSQKRGHSFFSREPSLLTCHMEQKLDQASCDTQEGFHQELEKFLCTNFHSRTGTEEAGFERESCVRLRREVGEESAQKRVCTLYERAVYW
jgi:hypothetical protein